MDEYPEPVAARHAHERKLLSGSKKPPVTIGLLPGSRKSEIKNLLGIMAEAAFLINEKKPGVRFLVSRPDSVSGEFFENIFSSAGSGEIFEIKKGPVKHIFEKTDLVIAASGTVTLEAALCCVPTIIVYRMSYLSYRIAKMIVRVKYAGLANLIAGRMIMPELLQYDATPEKISKKALNMLDNLLYCETQLKQVRTLLGRKGAPARTARICLDMLCDLR
jgi:lipid-A-disaccharide synthase